MMDEATEEGGGVGRAGQPSVQVYLLQAAPWRVRGGPGMQQEARNRPADSASPLTRTQDEA